MYLVGNPRPTNPEGKMAAVAKRRGWPDPAIQQPRGRWASGGRSERWRASARSSRSRPAPSGSAC